MSQEERIRPKPFKYTLFWTWDHSTNWDMTQRGMQTSGCKNPYLKRPEAFLSDYKMLINFASEHRIGGIIIWGFVRDSHGGIEYSQEICNYARERGVRILPGVGTSVYGGFYYEGKHRFSTKTWIEEHPDLRAIGAEGQLEDRPCPSRPSYQEWLREGTAWLYDTFKIGGVNLEHGDFRICYCEHCKKMREELGGDEADYFKEMAISEKPVIEVAHEKDPASWITYATYTGFDPKSITPPPRFPQYMPEYAICQWTLTFMYAEDRWPDGLRPPTRHSIGFIHQGSQWWTHPNCPQMHSRHWLILKTIRDVCAKAAASGLEGVGMHGEVSPIFPEWELNYLAFEYFTQHPGASLEDLFSGPLSAKFGGKEAALKALGYLRVCIPGQGHEVYQQRKKIFQQVKDVAYGFRDNLEIARLWGYVAHCIEMGRELL